MCSQLRPSQPTLADLLVLAEPRVWLLQQLGGGGDAGCPPVLPQGPLWPGPVLDLARPPTARFNPPSRPPGTHPDSQDLPAASAHPGGALPRAAPCIPLASHRCCPLKPPAAPSRQLCGVGAGHSQQHCEEPGQTDRPPHTLPPAVRAAASGAPRADPPFLPPPPLA